MGAAGIIGQQITKAPFRTFMVVAIGPLLDAMPKLFGKTGQVFYDKTSRATTAGTIAYGTKSSLYRKIADNIPKERFETTFVDMLEGKAADVSLESKRQWVRAILNSEFQLAEKAGITTTKDVRFIENYFTQFPSDLSSYMFGGKRRTAMVDKIMLKWGTNRTIAERTLDSQIAKHARVKTFGPLDYNRTVGFDEYRRDKAVID